MRATQLVIESKFRKMWRRHLGSPHSRAMTPLFCLRQLFGCNKYGCRTRLCQRLMRALVPDGLGDLEARAGGFEGFGEELFDGFAVQPGRVAPVAVAFPP